MLSKDIFCYICQWLPDQDRIAFAITCRTYAARIPALKRDPNLKQGIFLGHKFPVNCKTFADACYSGNLWLVSTFVEVVRREFCKKYLNLVLAGEKELPLAGILYKGSYSAVKAQRHNVVQFLRENNLFVKEQGFYGACASGDVQAAKFLQTKFVSKNFYKACVASDSVEMINYFVLLENLPLNYLMTIIKKHKLNLFKHFHKNVSTDQILSKCIKYQFYEAVTMLSDHLQPQHIAKLLNTSFIQTLTLTSNQISQAAIVRNSLRYYSVYTPGDLDLYLNYGYNLDIFWKIIKQEKHVDWNHVIAKLKYNAEDIIIYTIDNNLCESRIYIARLSEYCAKCCERVLRKIHIKFGVVCCEQHCPF